MNKLKEIVNSTEFIKACLFGVLTILFTVGFVLLMIDLTDWLQR